MKKKLTEKQIKYFAEELIDVLNDVDNLYFDEEKFTYENYGGFDWECDGLCLEVNIDGEFSVEEHSCTSEYWGVPVTEEWSSLGDLKYLNIKEWQLYDVDEEEEFELFKEDEQAIKEIIRESLGNVF